MHRRPNERYLMVLSDIHTDDQINMFAENDIEVTPAIMYRTVSTPWPKDKDFNYDLIALFTPAGVTSLKENFPDWKQGNTIIAAFGEGTIRALEEAGYRPVLVWVQTDLNEIKHRMRHHYKKLEDAKNALAESYKKIEAPSDDENPLVISGKHTFSTQCKNVLTGLSERSKAARK